MCKSSAVPLFIENLDHPSHPNLLVPSDLQLGEVNLGNQNTLPPPAWRRPFHSLGLPDLRSAQLEQVIFSFRKKLRALAGAMRLREEVLVHKKVSHLHLLPLLHLLPTSTFPSLRRDFSSSRQRNSSSAGSDWPTTSFSPPRPPQCLPQRPPPTCVVKIPKFFFTLKIIFCLYLWSSSEPSWVILPPNKLFLLGDDKRAHSLSIWR